MNRLMLNLLGFSLLLLASVAPLLSVEAAEALPQEKEREEENREAAPSPPNRTLSGSEQRRADDKGTVFRPSEDISEDLAVTFPVDI